MHRPTALRIHFFTILAGVIISLAIAVCCYVFLDFTFMFSAAIFGVSNIPFLLGGGIFLYKFRRNLVVPKYPYEKVLNKKITNYPYVDLGFAVFAVLFLLHNIIFGS